MIENIGQDTSVIVHTGEQHNAMIKKRAVHQNAVAVGCFEMSAQTSPRVEAPMTSLIHRLLHMFRLYVKSQKIAFERH